MKSENMENDLPKYVFNEGKPDFDGLWAIIYKSQGNKIKEGHMAERKGGFRIFAWVLSFVIIAGIAWFGLEKISVIKKNEKIEKGEAIVVSLVVGDVQVNKMGSSGWRVVNVEDILQMGDTIKTGSDSYCELQMVNRGLFRVEGASELNLAKLVNNNDKIDSRMKLAKGTVALKPNKLKEGENFEVETSTAVAAVRGTKFVVNVDNNGDTKVAVNEGKVSVKPVIKSIDEAQQKGIVSEKATEMLKNDIVKPVEVNPGEEISLSKDKVQDLDNSIGKVINNVADKQEGKQITETTLDQMTMEKEKNAKGKVTEKEVTESQLMVSEIQKDINPEVSAKTPVSADQSVVSAIVQKQEISQDSKNSMDQLNENKIINKVADMVNIRFDSTPSGADVYFDDNKIGVTPFNSVVEKGKKANIKFKKEGYGEDSRDVTFEGSLNLNSVLSQVTQTAAITETNTNAVASESNSTALNTEVKKLPGQLEWERPIPFKMESAYREPADPVIYRGKIFIAKNNRLYILSVEGKLQKSIAVVEDGVKLTRPSVSDGIVYVGSDNGGIYAYSTSGEMLWKKDAGSEKYGASPTAGYGMVAVPSIEKGVMIFDKEGNLIAQVESDSIYSAPLLLNKGKTLIYATESGNIISYDIESKTQNWSKGYNERFLYPLVGSEDIIAVVRASGKVIAVKPSDGSLLWSAAFEELQKTRINPIFAQGDLVLANNDKSSTVIIINTLSGKVISKTSFENETIAPPFVTDKFLYIGTESGKIYSYDVRQKKYDWTYKSSGNSISLVVADKDNIYALSSDGMLKLIR